MAIPPLLDDSITRIAARVEASQMFSWLGIVATPADDHLLYRLSFTEDHIGNPVLRALHGGVISSFLEACAQLDIIARVEKDVQVQPVSIHTSYFTSSRPQDMLAKVTIRRLGRRLAFLECDGWQRDQATPVARAAIGLRIIRPSSADAP